MYHQCRNMDGSVNPDVVLLAEERRYIPVGVLDNPDSVKYAEWLAAGNEPAAPLD